MYNYKELGRVDAAGVEISPNIYFARSRVGLRLATPDGDEVVLAALDQEAVDKLLHLLQELRDV